MAEKTEQKTKASRVFEIVHGTIAIDPKKKPRVVGEEIKESEIDAKTIDFLLKENYIRDTAKPLSPAEVVESITDHFLELAQRLSLVTNEGATYTFDGREFKGLLELKKSLTAATLKDAIAAAFAAKNAAIAQFTKAKS